MGGTIDNLDYDYLNGEASNRLAKVADASNNSEGFKNGTNTGDDYRYDANGNLVMDKNKGIGTDTVDGIGYNHLNLPVSVAIDNGTDIGTISYIYDALGTKLKKTVTGTSSGSTEYAGLFVYENGDLAFFNTPEGYVMPKNINDYSAGFDYVYNYVDHLGNVRLSYQDANGDGDITVSSDPNLTEIVEENNYYPFGLEHKGYKDNISPLGNSTAQKWKFGGKELDESFSGILSTYDFGARNYDPALGRWMNLDPLAEKYAHFTPYHYVYNNPTNFMDPDGEEGIVVSGQPGDHKNKQHFLANGYAKALAAQGKVQDKNEKVTWIVYNDGSESAGHSPAQLKEYRKKAEKAGINFKVVDKVDDIVDYINNKNGGDSRKKDRISSFYYVGHATPGDLDVGYAGSGENFEPDDLNSDAFRSGAWVNCVGGCRTSVPGLFEDSVLTQFAEILDELSTISGVDVRVFYSGGVQSDSEIAKKNKGTISSKKGELPVKKKDNKKDQGSNQGNSKKGRSKIIFWGFN